MQIFVVNGINIMLKIAVYENKGCDSRLNYIKFFTSNEARQCYCLFDLIVVKVFIVLLSNKTDIYLAVFSICTTNSGFKK
jgi:hypothetical protein